MFNVVNIRQHVKISTVQAVQGVGDGAVSWGSDRQTDRYGEANRRFWKFCERAWKATCMLWIKKITH